MDSERRLAIWDMVGRIGLFGWFFFLLLNEMLHVGQHMKSDWMSPTELVWLASEVAKILFFGLVCVTVITRLRPIRSADGIEAYLTALAGTYLLGLITYLPPAPEASFAIRLFALALITTGMLASAYVIIWLGRSMSIVPEARKFVTGGPYSIVRHPLYLTEEIAVIGIIVLNLSMWSVLLGIVHWCLQLRRMVNEERILGQAFPEYDEYARKVPRIIPWPRPVARSLDGT